MKVIQLSEVQTRKYMGLVEQRNIAEKKQSDAVDDITRINRELIHLLSTISSTDVVRIDESGRYAIIDVI